MRLRVLGSPGSALQQTGVQTSAGFVPVGEVGEFTPEEQTRITSIFALEEVGDDAPVYGSSEYVAKLEDEHEAEVPEEEPTVADGEPLPEPEEQPASAFGAFGNYNDEEVK
jgi:hypothetical protein